MEKQEWRFTYHSNARDLQRKRGTSTTLKKARRSRPAKCKAAKKMKGKLDNL